MRYTYRVTGMTCGKCEERVKNSILKLAGVTKVEVSKEKQIAVVDMDQPIPLAILQDSIGSPYAIAEPEIINGI